ncbi:hypothetical protein KUCAC02_017826 [Chaenocephalus aceratus]|uniref:Uncharacterized protein n=1 Tax=Chaenocephalus aceratus TaxID=36190 RepID=A0ACB9W2E8_CHAAC|nr:hypothetical protein KUCAC02_017826 [Chaenocephalus aceratus]
MQTALPTLEENPNLLCIHLRLTRPKNFPPGPTPLPILGNLLNLSVHNPMKDLERLRKSYGNVYSLFIGPKPIVVINGVQALKEAMLTKGLVLADYGPSWKEQRHFAVTTLWNLGLGTESMEQRILRELHFTMETLEKSIGSTMNPQFLFSNLASNIISLIGTVVIPNMKSVLNEEGQWKFPHEFNPENFLNDEGEFVQPEAFMSFCAGPRMCPGERLAQMKFFFIIVTLLRKFKFIWPEDAGEPD